MDRRVLVDSSALVALFHRRDQNHRRASRTWKALVSARSLLMVPDYVMGEVVTYFKRFSFEGCRTAASRLTAFQAAGVIEAVCPEWADWEAALSGVLAVSDPGYTLFDAVTVAVATREEIKTIFSYDRVFADLGFPSP